MTHTRYVRAVAVLSLIALLGAGCGAPLSRPSAPPAATPTQEKTDAKTVAYVRLAGASKVKVMVTRGGKAIEAADGAELESGDEVDVVTGTAILSYPGTGASKLEEGTKVRIVADEGASGIFMRLKLLGGSIWTRLERLLGPNEHVSVSAEGVVATVRGTAFGVVSVPGSADILVADHEVEVAAVGGESDMAHVLTVPAGSGVKLAGSAPLRQEGEAFRRLVRLLSQAEMSQEGYVFARTALDPNLLKAPANAKPLSLPPADRADLLNELINLRDAVAKRRSIDLNARFVEPGSTPTIKGPSR